MTASHEHVFGAITLWSFVGDPAEFALQPEDEDEAVTFVFIEAGLLSSRLRDEPWITMPGAFIIAPDGVDRRVRFDRPWRANMVRIPRTTLTAFVPRMPTTIWSPRRRHTIDLAMQAFVASLARSSESIGAVEAYALEQLLAEMAGAVLLDRIGVETPRLDPSEALRERATTVIAQQCADPDLTPRAGRTGRAGVAETVAGRLRGGRTDRRRRDRSLPREARPSAPHRQPIRRALGGADRPAHRIRHGDEPAPCPPRGLRHQPQAARALR